MCCKYICKFANTFDVRFFYKLMLICSNLRLEQMRILVMSDNLDNGCHLGQWMTFWIKDDILDNG